MTYCPFAHLAAQGAAADARQIASTALCVHTYAQLKAALRKLDALNRTALARYLAPNCAVFEAAASEWIPMHRLHTLASVYLESAARHEQ